VLREIRFLEKILSVDLTGGS